MHVVEAGARCVCRSGQLCQGLLAGGGNQEQHQQPSYGGQAAGRHCGETEATKGSAKHATCEARNKAAHCCAVGLVCRCSGMPFGKSTSRPRPPARHDRRRLPRSRGCSWCHLPRHRVHRVPLATDGRSCRQPGHIWWSPHHTPRMDGDCARKCGQ
jgi:hypothetical protein